MGHPIVVPIGTLRFEGHGARVKFRQETWQGESLVFALLILEVQPRKT